MNDLDDLRPPDARPAPDELRQRISADLARAARPPRLRSVVVAAAVLAILTGLVVAGLTWGPRPEPAAPSMGTLDVRTLSNEEAQRRLTSCLAELADTPERELPPAADWNLRYARMQYWRVEQLGDDQGSLVVLATSAAGVLRCTEQNSELSSPEPDLLSSPAALVTDDEPVLGCPGAVGDSVPAVLLKTRPTVRMARVRLTIDREPGRWWTAGAQGGFVHLPLVDAAQPTALAEAGQLSYEVQALDAKNAPVPITYPAGPEGGATTYVHEIASCADRAGQGVRPAKPAAAAEECTRLTRIAVRNGGPTAYRWRPVLDGADRQLWLSLPPDGDGVLCSLAPVRGVRLLSHGTSLEDQQGLPRPRTTSTSRSPTWVSAGSTSGPAGCWTNRSPRSPTPFPAARSPAPWSVSAAGS